jgi:hypothetical protein
MREAVEPLRTGHATSELDQGCLRDYLAFTTADLLHYTKSAEARQGQTFAGRGKSALPRQVKRESRFSLGAHVVHLGRQHERSVSRKSVHTNATASATETASSSIGLVVIA